MTWSPRNRSDEDGNKLDSDDDDDDEKKDDKKDGEKKDKDDDDIDINIDGGEFSMLYYFLRNFFYFIIAVLNLKEAYFSIH